MRIRFNSSPGRHGYNWQHGPFPHPDPCLLALHAGRRFRVSFLLALLFLTTTPCIVTQDVLAEEIQVRGKTTITVLPLREKNHRPVADPAAQRLQIQRLLVGIKEHEDKIKASQERGKRLLEELERIEVTLKIQQRKLTVLKDSLDLQEKLLAQEQNRLDQAIAEKQELQAYIQKRLTAYYQMGGIGLMNVLFSKKSLSELLSFQEYFARLLRYDRLAISSYQSKITELTQVRRRHELEKKRLQELVGKVRVREELLNATQQEQQTLLSRVQTEEKLYQQAVVEIQKAAAALSASLAARSRQVGPAPVVRPDTAKRKPQAGEQPSLPADHTFLLLKGKLAPPVDGTVTVDHEGRQGKRGAILPLVAGIDIITAKKQPILAIYDGTVIASGFLGGYGNMIIIDHGQHYYSLVSRAGEILKEEGTTVRMGDVIGTTGDSDVLLDSGLHFEIRHGSANEDPLEWLDQSRLNFKE